MLFRHLLLIRRSFDPVCPRKNFAGDGPKAVQTLAEPGTGGLRIEVQGLADFVVAKVAKVTQLDDFAAGFAEFLQGTPEQGHLFGTDCEVVRPRCRGRRVNGRTVVVGSRVQGDRGPAAAAFDGLAALAVIAGLVGGDAKDPGLEPAVSLKRVEISYGRQEHVLAISSTSSQVKSCANWNRNRPVAA